MLVFVLVRMLVFVRMGLMRMAMVLGTFCFRSVIVVMTMRMVVAGIFFLCSFVILMMRVRMTGIIECNGRGMLDNESAIIVELRRRCQQVMWLDQAYL